MPATVIKNTFIALAAPKTRRKPPEVARRPTGVCQFYTIFHYVLCMLNGFWGSVLSSVTFGTTATCDNSRHMLLAIDTSFQIFFLPSMRHNLYVQQPRAPLCLCHFER